MVSQVHDLDRPSLHKMQTIISRARRFFGREPEREHAFELGADVALVSLAQRAELFGHHRLVERNDFAQSHGRRFGQSCILPV